MAFRISRGGWILGRPLLVSRGQMLLDVFKLGVGKVGGIAHHGPKRKPSHPSFRNFQTVSLGRWMNRGERKGRSLQEGPGMGSVRC